MIRLHLECCESSGFPIADSRCSPGHNVVADTNFDNLPRRRYEGGEQGMWGKGGRGI